MSALFQSAADVTRGVRAHEGKAGAHAERDVVAASEMVSARR